MKQTFIRRELWTSCFTVHPPTAWAFYSQQSCILTLLAFLYFQSKWNWKLEKEKWNGYSTPQPATHHPEPFVLMTSRGLFSKENVAEIFLYIKSFSAIYTIYENAKIKSRHNSMCHKEVQQLLFTLVIRIELTQSICQLSELFILKVSRLCFWIFSFFDFKTRRCQRQIEQTVTYHIQCCTTLSY